jgi:hypothetical protein
VSRPSADVAAALTAEVNRQVSPQEVRAYLDAPVSKEERDEVLAMTHWFRRRYPTPADRLAYVRRTYRRWATSSRR